METTQTVLISGTSSGIGLATAIAAARAGWTTIAGVRDLDRATALRTAAAEAGVPMAIRQLDVTDAESIQACLDGVIGEYGRLDALVNNAGAAHLGTVENENLVEFRACIEVNFFGVVQLSKAAMVHLRASGGRLITVSSVGGVIGQPFNEAYCAAKFAVEGFLEALAPVAAAVGVGVSVVEPGAVASEFVTNAGLDPASLVGEAGPYGTALRNYLDRTMKQFGSGAQSASEVGELIAGLLQAQPLPFRVQTSDWARQFVSTKLSDLDGSQVTGLTTGWVG